MTFQSVSLQSPIPESAQASVSGEKVKVASPAERKIEVPDPIGPQSVIRTDDLAKKLNKFTERLGTELSFSVDRDLNQVIVTVARQDTKEVIRQIPPQETVELAKRLREMEYGGDNKGLIFGMKG